MEFLYLNTTTAGIIIILVLAYAYDSMQRRLKAAKKTEAPKAAGAWPIIGHLPLFAGSELPHIRLGNLADKYGPIFTVQIGVHQPLVVSSWEMAKELFSTNDTAVSDRPMYTAAYHLGYQGVMFGFAPYGDYWREIRRIVHLELLSKRRLELLSYVKESEVKTLIKELYKSWKEKNSDSGSGYVLVDMTQLLGDMGLNLILGLIIGRRKFGATPGCDRNEMERCRKALRGFFHYLGMFVLRDALPFLGWLDVGGHEKAMKRLAKEMDDLLNQWLEEHRRTIVDGGLKDDKEKDLMDALLSALEGIDFVGYDHDLIIKSACLNLIAGGSDTATVNLIWMVSLLLNNRHALKRAQEELDMCVGRERQVKESDVDKLKYLQAIVKETLRLYPAAPLSGPRMIRENCIIGGYHIKKGTHLITNLWKIQRDPRIWEDPLEFKPERFLGSNKNIDVWGKQFELIPFGSGRRSCPGIILALQMAHITLASFLQAFDISNPTSASIDMTGSFGLTYIKATPLQVLISPRLPPHLYA